MHSSALTGFAPRHLSRTLTWSLTWSVAATSRLKPAGLFPAAYVILRLPRSVLSQPFVGRLGFVIRVARARREQGDLNAPLQLVWKVCPGSVVQTFIVHYVNGEILCSVDTAKGFRVPDKFDG